MVFCFLSWLTERALTSSARHVPLKIAWFYTSLPFCILLIRLYPVPPPSVSTHHRLHWLLFRQPAFFSPCDWQKACLPLSGYIKALHERVLTTPSRWSAPGGLRRCRPNLWCHSLLLSSGSVWLECFRGLRRIQSGKETGRYPLDKEASISPWSAGTLWVSGQISYTSQNSYFRKSPLSYQYSYPDPLFYSFTTCFN